MNSVVIILTKDKVHYKGYAQEPPDGRTQQHALQLTSCDLHIHDRKADRAMPDWPPTQHTTGTIDGEPRSAKTKARVYLYIWKVRKLLRTLPVRHAPCGSQCRERH